jgi:hypothetical protein
VQEAIFFQFAVKAYDPDRPNDNTAVSYIILAGSLPPGVQCLKNGLIEGIPKAIVSLQGVPLNVAQDTDFRFAVRAYTSRIVDGVEVFDRIADRTFELTVSGQDDPEFITPAGNVGTFYDGTAASIQIEFTDEDPGDIITITRLNGELPPGLTLNRRTGLISGVIQPLTGVPGSAQAGWMNEQWDEYPWDFTTRSASKNYQFVLELSDGKSTATRQFEIYVYSKDSMSADTTDFTADNTFITADVVPTRTPVLLTPTGFLGTFKADNYFAFKFNSIDWDGDAVEYVTSNLGLPPGLELDPYTGWLYGYIPDQGATEFTYRFSIEVRKRERPTIISNPYNFTITITGDINTEIIWVSPQFLGTMDNGGISYFSVEAVNTGGRPLQYRIESGSASKLPQGLTLQPSGNIVGRASFNTFSLDGGSTTFDEDLRTRLDPRPTTFDLSFTFRVNAFSPQTQQQGFQISSYIIGNGGSGFTSDPTVTVSAPPDVEGAIQAVPGAVIIRSGVIVEIGIGNPGRGYISPPTVTITGGGGTGAVVTAAIRESTLVNAVSVFRDFTILINREYNKPYEALYVKCMPPKNDRDIINSLVQNQDVIPQNILYRSDDPNFGVAQNVIYQHAFGLTAASYAEYVSSLSINHYWKNLTLGPIKTAQAVDTATGRVIYEVVYSEIIDDQVNKLGQSVSKEKTLPYPVTLDDSTVITTVYPNSLINMRDQVIDVVGQTSSILPLWMTSKQTNGQVLGFTPAWTIAYVKPGESERVAYNIRTRFGSQINVIDFKVDRYILDKSQTYNWDTQIDKWIPYPPIVTTFDDGFVYGVVLNNGGSGYAVNDVMSISGTLIGGVNTVNDALLTVIATGAYDTIEISDSRGDSTIGQYEVNDFVTSIASNENWNPYTSYSAGIIVTIGGQPEYYQSIQNVPAGTPEDFIDYTDAAYWRLYTFVPTLGIVTAVSPLGDTVTILRNNNIPFSRILRKTTTLTIDGQAVTVFDDALCSSVDTVSGIVTGVSVTGTANSNAKGNSYSNLTSTNVIGNGVGAIFTIIAPTTTIFDGRGTTFTAPADRWNPLETFNKYLVFPRTNILG